MGGDFRLVWGPDNRGECERFPIILRIRMFSHLRTHMPQYGNPPIPLYPVECHWIWIYIFPTPPNIPTSRMITPLPAQGPGPGPSKCRVSGGGGHRKL